MLSLLISTAMTVSMAAAADPTSASGLDANAPAPAEEKRICKSMPMPGTRLGGRRVCATKAEWARRTAETRKTLEEQQRNIQWTVEGSSGQ